MVAEFWVLQRVWGCCRMGWTRGVGVKIVVVCVCIMWHGRKLGSVGGGVLRKGGCETPFGVWRLVWFAIPGCASRRRALECNAFGVGCPAV